MHIAFVNGNFYDLLNAFKVVDVEIYHLAERNGAEKFRRQPEVGAEAKIKMR